MAIRIQTFVRSLTVSILSILLTFYGHPPLLASELDELKAKSVSNAVNFPPMVRNVRQLLAMEFEEIITPPADCIDVERVMAAHNRNADSPQANELIKIVDVAIDQLTANKVQFEDNEAYNVIQTSLQDASLELRENIDIAYFRGPFEFDEEGRFHELEQCLPFLESYLDWSVGAMLGPRAGWLNYRKALGLDITKIDHDSDVVDIASSIVASRLPTSLQSLAPELLRKDRSWRDWLIRTMVELPQFEVGERSLSTSQRELFNQEYRQAKREQRRNEYGRLLVDQYSEIYQSQLIRRARKLKQLVYNQVERGERDFDSNLLALGVVLPFMRVGSFVASLNAFESAPTWIRAVTPWIVDASLTVPVILASSDQDVIGLTIRGINEDIQTARKEAELKGKNPRIAMLRVGAKDVIIVLGPVVVIYVVTSGRLSKVIDIKRAGMALKSIAK